MDLSGTWESLHNRLKEVKVKLNAEKEESELMDRQAVGSVHSKEKDMGNYVSVTQKCMSLKGLTIICN